jgi:hypothetical protein
MREFTAKDARHCAERNSKFSSVLDEIIEKIEDAAKEGEFSVVVEFPAQYCSRLYSKLIELGYGVEEPPDEDDDGENYETLITW